MIINHNLPALNTYNKLATNQAAGQKSLEKLSSGLRINRAGDDAAGLAISEKMRAQVRGLDQAGRNAQDGISMIQTAEGGLNEVHSILQRMRELADQSANGTNTADDRSAIQAEVSQLKSEIDRIGNTTEFNTQKLLNGNLQSVGAAVGTNTTTGGSVAKLSAAIMTSNAGVNTAHANLSFTASSNSIKDTFNIDGHNIEVNWDTLLNQSQKDALKAIGTSSTTADMNNARDIIVNGINKAIEQYNATNAAGATVQSVTGWLDSSNKLNISSGNKGVDSQFSFTGSTASASSVGGYFISSAAANATSTATGSAIYNGTTISANTSFNVQLTTNDGKTINLNATVTTALTGGTTDMSTAAGYIQSAINTAISSYNTLQGITSVGVPGYISDAKVIASKDGRFQVSDEAGTLTFSDKAGASTVSDMGLSQAQTASAGNGGMTFQIGANKDQTLNFGINDMRTSALGLSGVDVSTASGASNALSTLDKAIKSVSSERAKLGAVQNRLEHTINNLATSSENLTAAESRIRDVNMAKEMMDFSKMNILTQAAQAMMAQANQQPQGVLQLLR